MIEALVGAGGMGEVYRARDPRLNRDVALKFLHSAAGTERFQREAQVIASLNHPNIVAVYDVGPDYIVTEFVEGKPLRGLKPSLRDAVDWAAQIASGLAAAHLAGITHRDLKPDNVMITGPASRDPGRVKILDFGLAHQTALAVAGDSAATRTIAGTVMGTAGYMSPEQARGQTADSRSDIFSFGATLYEMLSGRPPFAAETTAQTMAAVIEKDPPPLPDSVPSALQGLVERCLRKEPGQRFQSAADLAYSLRTLNVPTISSSHPAARPRRARQVTTIALVAAAAGLVLFAALWALRPWQPDLAAFRFIPFATEEYPEYGPAWSPDGRSIAYSAITDNEFRILLKDVDGGLPTILARHPMPGSNVNNVAGGVSWSADGSRLFYVFLLQGWSVARTGGTPEPLKLGELNSRVRSLAASPDGAGLAIDRGILSGNRVLFSLWFSPFNGSPPAKLTDAGGRTLSDLAWAPDSSQLLGSRSTGGGVEMFLIGRNGTTRSLLEGEKQRILYSAWLPDSRHALVASSPSHPGIRLVDTRSGQVRAVLPSATTVGTLSVSRDGKVAATIGTSRASIMEIPLDGAPPHSFLNSRANNSQLAWSADGAEFAYVYEEEIRIRNRAGTAERTVVSRRDFPNHRGPLPFEKPSFSPDGQRLLYTIFGVQGHENGVWISPVNGGAPAAVSQVEGFAPLWTANGASLLVNVSSALPNSARAFGGGMWRVRLGGSDSAEQISSGACDPALSPDGKWMVCPAGQDGMTLVSLESKESRVITRERMVTGAFSRDGSSIYAIRAAGDKQELARVEVATGRIQTVSILPLDLVIGGPYGGPTRLALAPDAKSVFTTIRKVEGDIWILDGFNPPRSIWERLWPRKP